MSMASTIGSARQSCLGAMRFLPSLHTGTIILSRGEDAQAFCPLPCVSALLQTGDSEEDYSVKVNSYKNTVSANVSFTSGPALQQKKQIRHGFIDKCGQTPHNFLVLVFVSLEIN